VSDGVQRFLEAARVLGHDVDVRRFPEGTHTAQDAARAIGCDLAQIVKSLVFMSDDRPLLALTSGVNRADAAKLRALTGASSLRRANADEVRSATGYPIGGTPPFGHPERIATFIDEDLMTHGEVWAGAGGPDAVFGITPRELRTATGGTVADVRET
jgi:prolyl-tRNA editing enzyme YbaK/EbsC (Cys-tRNA(Pro) deacylase)